MHLFEVLLQQSMNEFSLSVSRFRLVTDFPGKDSNHDSVILYTELWFNLLTPNVNYSGCTAPLTSKVAFYIFIQQI